MTDAKHLRALRSFERAVEDKAFEGTVPYISDDPEEQRAMTAKHRWINANYTRSRNALLKLLEGSN